MKAIRAFDCAFSLMGLILLSPLFLLVIVLVKATSKGPVLYTQARVGKDGELFLLYKFRTMRTGADKNGLLTVGGRDNRITPIGFYLRKYKLDELPQLMNVLLGDMSLVGPRPEVPKYVALYTPEQRQVLLVRPGITDMASILYRNENELLAAAANPEEFYINTVMPDKIRLNYVYLQQRSLSAYFKIIVRTVWVSIKGK